MDNITSEEKIDYIYSRLKKQESHEKIKFISRWLFRIVIVLYIVYLYKVALPAFKEELLTKITPDINLQELNIQDSETLNKVKDYINNNF